MRTCDDWLEAYRQWTLPRSEAPETFVTWAGLFTLASVLKRQVYFPKRLMGSYEIVPNLYVVFVGPPGVVRKTTTTEYPTELLNSVDGIAMSSTAMSKSKLIERMVELSEDKEIGSNISILSGEFSNFINVSREEMYDLLTDLFDGKAKYEYSTRLHGDEVAEKPCVNLLAATIPDWIDAQPPEHITGGGFSSRVIFIFENQRRRNQMYYDEVVNHAEIERLGIVIKNDLAHISKLEGEFRHDRKTTKDLMEEWYQTECSVARGDERVAGYYNRKHVHVHKVAMLLSCARRDDLTITRKDFEEAVKLLETVEKKMPDALANVGKNPYAKFMHQIEHYIQKATEPVALPRIMSRFHHNLRPDETRDILAFLVMTNRIKKHTKDEGHPSYS